MNVELRGNARSPGRSFQAIIREDGDVVPAPLLEEAPFRDDLRPIDKARFHTASWHQQEVETIWRKCWQMACREEEIPGPGDYIVYDIADTSLIVMRGEDGGIKAFYNSCLHRGTQLLPSGSRGSVPAIQCPFHGWRFSNDGELADLPCGWDFPQVDKDRARLPEVKTGRWGGFVFVNPDPDCDSLESYLGVIPEHFAAWEMENRRIGAHIAKIIGCNWKLGLEAFMEGYHVAATHPQALAYTGDINCQYDCWGPNVSRMMSGLATVSPRLKEGSVSETEIVDALRGFIVGDLGDPASQPGATARSVAAGAIRRMLSDATGIDHQAPSTTEILDAIQYFVFPNFVPWAGYGTPIVYRFRPYGNDPDKAIMEVYLLYAADEAKRAAEPPETHWLALEDSWTKATELGRLGEIFDQDEADFARIQRGVKAGGNPAVILSVYQESRIRHFHQTLDGYVLGGGK